MGVRVKREADVGSDHHMVVAAVRVKLKKTGGKRPGRKHFDDEKLYKTPKSGILLLCS